MEDMEAIIFCHEYDHLSGIEYTDRAEWIKSANVEQRIEIRKEYSHLVEDKTCEFIYPEVLPNQRKLK